MARRIVCLTFDFDAVSGWISRGMTTPSPMSRGEFGLVGSRRVLALLKKYRIRSTWFIPGHTIESFPDHARAVVEAGHEIAHHGWTHVPPALMKGNEEQEGLLRGIKAIRKLSGKKPLGYRSPSWDLSPRTIDLLLENGFRYDSSMMGDDYAPYWARRGDVVELQKPMVMGKPTKLVEMPISWHLDDYPHFEFLRTPNYILQGLMNARGVLQNWTDEFLYMTRAVEDWGALTYTFHPFVIGRGYRMLILEELITKLLEMGAVFLAMEDAVEEWLKRAGGAKRPAKRRGRG